MTNWRTKSKDALEVLILNQTNSIDLEAMYKGGGASKMGKVRALWSGHLGIDEDELRVLVRTLAVNLRIRSGSDLKEHLNDKFAAVGMRRVPSDESGFSYDDLIRKLHAQGRKEFDRSSFRALVNDEKLLSGPKETARSIVGVKSFIHPIDTIEARATRTLDLVGHFEGRFLKGTSDWNLDILPELKKFVLDEARKGDNMTLLLDAHVSLAFAIGSILNVKSGRSIEIEQRSGGRRFWSREDVPVDSSWPGLDISVEKTGEGKESALAVGLTHDISPMVRKFLEGHADIGKLVVARPANGSSGASVRSGSHAMKMAEEIVDIMRREGRTPLLHVFLAAPNGFTFFLGQYQHILGRTTVYEWDLDGIRSGSYSAGLTIN